LVFIFEEYRLDLDRRELTRAGAPVAVEPLVFDLLAYLVRNREKVVSKDELIAAVWNGRIVSDSALASCINAARAAIGDDGERQRLIKTLPRKGVRFVGAIEDEPASEAPASAATVANSAALALPDRPSIAVLLFNNMSSDSEQEYFADGMVEDIIAGLARINWLFVIARNSSFIYKGRAVDVRQVGRELGVRYVLQGGVRKAGDRVRISTQLIDAETGAHVWVERFDRTLQDIFALQDEIAMSVVGAIEPTLRYVETVRAGRQRPHSLEAYDLVLRASPFAYSHLADEAAIAIPLLQKALELEPSYAGAHAPLALCYHARYSRAGLRQEDRAAAIDHAQSAVKSGGDDPSALGIAGFVMSLDAHEHDTALGLFDRALRLSDSNFFALSSSALVLSWLGDAPTALERSGRALRLSPFDRLNYLSLNARAIAYFHLRQFEQACDAAKRSVELNPRFSVSRAFLAAVLAELGRNAEAKAEAGRVLALDPTFSVKRFLVTVGIKEQVFRPLVDAWRAAGLPLS
jgi:TolB-like protein